jgi:hypothetical protein
MTALNSWALTSEADVKESLGITGTSQDNLIRRKINQATDMIESYCGKNNGQHFASTTYTNEEYDGTGTNQLILRNAPVISLSNFSERNTTENDNDWTTIETRDYFVDLTAGVIDCRFGILPYWNLYKVTYVAGFTTIPSDLAEACVMLSCALVESASTGASVKKKTQGPKTIEYYDSVQGESLITQLGIDDMLQRYVRISILPDK